MRMVLTFPLNAHQMVTTTPEKAYKMATRVALSFKRSAGSSWAPDKVIVDATVHFLNGAEIIVDGREFGESDEVVNRSEGTVETLETLFASIRSKANAFPNAALLESEGAENSVDAGNDEMRYRAVLRGIFCAFAQNPTITREHFLEHEITWHLQGDTFFRATGIFRTYRLDNYQNVVTVGSALLLDQKEGLGQKLCQCHLLTCRKFFWEISVPRGRPKRRYCSPEHLDESHNLNAANRTKISRERKKRRDEEAKRLPKFRRRNR
jgi:hypothetical protein